jgi:hypothetical protein
MRNECIKSLTPDPQNPNRMSADDKARMLKSLAEFGDLSGVIINRRTGLLIGGHQRADVLSGATLDVTDLPTPEPDGTVARGWLVHSGKRYAVRVVDWPERKAKAALLAANRFGRVGADDPELLAGLLRELGADAEDVTGYDAAAIEKLTGEFSAGEVGAPELKDGDRAPFRQATFTLHDEQWEEVEAALAKAKKDGGGESAVNENSNGNALAWICGRFNRG